MPSLARVRCPDGPASGMEVLARGSGRRPRYLCWPFFEDQANDAGNEPHELVGGLRFSTSKPIEMEPPSRSSKQPCRTMGFAEASKMCGGRSPGL